MTPPRLTNDPARRDQILTTLLAWMNDESQVLAAQERAIEPAEAERFVLAATRLGEPQRISANC